MKRQLAATLIATSVALFSLPAFAATIEQERESIQKVVETFRVSLIKKDPETFMKLFYSDSIPWIGVTKEADMVREKAERKLDPKLPEPQKLSVGSPRKFIQNISKGQEPIEETFDNIRIDTDGEVAQVWFDYRFIRAGYKQNWGKESWHMLKTTDGWKISSVIWSMEFNQVPPPKRDK